MSDAVQLAIVNAIPAILVALFSGAASTITLVVTLRAKKTTEASKAVSEENRGAIKELHELVNGKTAQLVENTARAEHAEGKAEGKAESRAEARADKADADAKS